MNVAVVPRQSAKALVAPLLLCAGALGVACSAGDPGFESTAASAASSKPGGAHVMAPNTAPARRPLIVSSAGVTAAGPAGARLVYNAGKVIANVKVYEVLWGASVQNASAYAGFFGAVTSSAYMDLLGEYATSKQGIGRGSFAGTVTDTSPPPGTTIDDATIQQETDKLIKAGQLPPNDGNNLYFWYFPPGITITQGGGASCQAFCGYHSTYNSTAGGGEVYYAVIPDMGGACASGCGTGTQVDNTTTVSSHELAEAVTDPEVGLNTLSWYDQTNGEIGDICAWRGQDTVGGYAVQLEWSNAQALCASSPSGSTPTPDAGAPTPDAAGAADASGAAADAGPDADAAGPGGGDAGTPTPDAAPAPPPAADAGAGQSLVVAVTTQGANAPAAYAVTFDGVSIGSLAAQGSGQITGVPSGSHVLGLGIPPNCGMVAYDVSGNEIDDGDNTSITFDESLNGATVDVSVSCQ
jgi:hypothetical protein